MGKINCMKVNKMITSGLLVQNYGKGKFPSSYSKKTSVSSRPFVSKFDSGLPEIERPFDEIFTPTINYRHIFGKGATRDQKLYYLEHDMFQKMKQINSLPLKRKTKSKLGKKLDTGGLIDKFYFLEKLASKDGKGGVSMEDIQEWMNERPGNISNWLARIETESDSVSDKMSIDTRQILQSVASSTDIEEAKRRAIAQRTDPTLGELLDGTDVDALTLMFSGVKDPVQESIQQEEQLPIEREQSEMIIEDVTSAIKKSVQVNRKDGRVSKKQRHSPYGTIDDRKKRKKLEKQLEHVKSML